MNTITMSRITAMICLSVAGFCSRDPNFYVSALVLVATAFACLFVGYTDVIGRLTPTEKIAAKVATFVEDELPGPLMQMTSTGTPEEAARVLIQKIRIALFGRV